MTRLIVKSYHERSNHAVGTITHCPCCQPDSGSREVERRFVTGKESAVNVGRER